MSDLTKSNQDDKVYVELTQTINKIAVDRFNELLMSSEPVHLVYAPNGLMEQWLSGFSDELRQEYDCHACRNFFNGIGSFGYISSDLTIQPLVLDPLLEVDFPTFKRSWENVIQTFQDPTQFEILKTNALIIQILPLGQTHLGGFSHFSLDMEYPVVRSFIETNAVDDQQYIGEVNHTAISEQCDIFSRLAERFDDLEDIELFKLAADDRDTVNDLINVAHACVDSNPIVFVMQRLITHPNYLAPILKTPVWAFLSHLMAGGDIATAHTVYLKLTDPRYYKRPVQMSDEHRLSFDELTEQGFIGELPTRLITMDEIRDISTWSKPAELHAADLISNHEALQVEDEEPISMVGLKGVLIDLIERGVLRNIEFLVNGHLVGTIVNTESETGGRIYKDGKRHHLLLLSDPITPTEANMVYSKDSGNIESLIIENDDFGYPLFLGITGGQWKIPLPAAVFTEDLIPDLEPHFAAIEDWSSKTYINLDENNDLIAYENCPIVTLLSVGNVVVVTSETTQYNFRISSVR